MHDHEKRKDAALHSPNGKRRTLSSAAHALFDRASALPARTVTYVHDVISDIRAWPARKIEDQERIGHIAIAATVAPSDIKKALLHAARIRSGVVWLTILIATYLVSIMGSVFSWVHVTNVIGASLALVIVIRLAIESARNATKKLLNFIEQDDPDNITQISPANFDVSNAMVLSPWIRNRNGLLAKLWSILRRKIENYIGLTR